MGINKGVYKIFVHRATNHYTPEENFCKTFRSRQIGYLLLWYCQENAEKTACRARFSVYAGGVLFSLPYFPRIPKTENCRHRDASEHVHKQIPSGIETVSEAQRTMIHELILQKFLYLVKRSEGYTDTCGERSKKPTPPVSGFPVRSRTRSQGEIRQISNRLAVYEMEDFVIMVHSRIQVSYVPKRIQGDSR